MLKYALMAVGAALVVAIVFVMLPTGKVVRQEPRILNSGDATPPAGFVIHDAPPPVPTTPDASATPPNPGGNLDTVMQRLRASAANPPAATPDAPAATTLAPVVVTPPPPAAPVVVVPSTPQWTSVTAQSTRWRMARAGDGYIVSIDLGAGQVANVRVAGAFGNLDTAAVNVRVDYLRDTIKENFGPQSGNYLFARDGSVSVDR